MSELYQHVDELIVKHLQQSLTEAEQLELQQWINLSAENKQLFDRLTQQESVQQELKQLYRFNEEKGWSMIKTQYGFGKEALEETGSRRFKWGRWAVAAGIVGLLFVAGYFLNRKEGPSTIAQDDKKNLQTDVKAPDKNRAMIILADGSKVYLDSSTNGELVKQGDVKLVKNADGSVEYSSAFAEASPDKRELVYNTLSNPRGSIVIDMTLSDGSKVWLNAGSSITFPVAFIGNERKVSITGEAYFEVAHNAAKPFYVSKGEITIQVLGTKFNVNAFDDEAELKVTLLEGKVQVTGSGTATNQTLMLKPGEQAVYYSNTVKLTKETAVDVEQVMAWKNERFIFSGNDIRSVMRQLSRWYDVDIQYEGSIPADEFIGVISRSRYENISSILNILEKTKTVQFKVEGRRVTVMPWKK